MTDFSFVACCHPDGPAPSVLDRAPAELTDMCAAMFAHLAGFAAQPPFTCFHLVLLDGAPAGGGGFVSPPQLARVEIAYFTLGAFEGQGVASALCGELVRLAWQADAGLTIFAKTLPQDCPSVSVLRRHGFCHKGSVTDHEIGEAWLWELAPGN